MRRFWTDLGVRDTISLRQGRGYLVVGAIVHFDEEFTEELAMAFLSLLIQGLLNLLFGYKPTRQKQLTELHLVFNS
ncbi:MAG: hypothetical protein ACYS8I_01665 [Planctomycetota bacterium]